MIELYFCKTDKREAFLRELLRGKGFSGDILRTENGKPYVSGAGIHFNLSHSGALCAVVLSDMPAGIDMELLRGRPHGAVLNSLSAEERGEIACERDFLAHWTAREAYVKLVGGRIWDYARRLQFADGRLFFDGKALREQVKFYHAENAVVAVCARNADFEVKASPDIFI